jgi:hypothetical protein
LEKSVSQIAVIERPIFHYRRQTTATERTQKRHRKHGLEAKAEEFSAFAAHSWASGQSRPRRGARSPRWTRHKLSMQLRAAEDRINQLEAEVELLRDRAVRAERWLQIIQKEIEEKLIAPRSANATEQTSLPQNAKL